jgi:hypothetical protein
MEVSKMYNTINMIGAAPIGLGCGMFIGLVFGLWIGRKEKDNGGK